MRPQLTFRRLWLALAITFVFALGIIALVSTSENVATNVIALCALFASFLTLALQSQQVESQVKEGRRQEFERRIFDFFQQHDNLVDRVYITSKYYMQTQQGASGQGALKLIYDNFSQAHKGRQGYADQGFWNYVSTRCWAELVNYIASVELTIDYIYRAPISVRDKRSYFRVFLSHLSAEEQAMLVYLAAVPVKKQLRDQVINLHLYEQVASTTLANEFDADFLKTSRRGKGS